MHTIDELLRMSINNCKDEIAEVERRLIEAAKNGETHASIPNLKGGTIDYLKDRGFKCVSPMGPQSDWIISFVA